MNRATSGLDTTLSAQPTQEPRLCVGSGGKMVLWEDLAKHPHFPMGAPSLDPPAAPEATGRPSVAAPPLGGGQALWRRGRQAGEGRREAARPERSSGRGALSGGGGCGHRGPWRWQALDSGYVLEDALREFDKFDV